MKIKYFLEYLLLAAVICVVCSSVKNSEIAEVLHRNTKIAAVIFVSYLAIEIVFFILQGIKNHFDSKKSPGQFPLEE